MSFLTPEVLVLTSICLTPEKGILGYWLPHAVPCGARISRRRISWWRVAPRWRINCRVDTFPARALYWARLPRISSGKHVLRGVRRRVGFDRSKRASSKPNTMVFAGIVRCQRPIVQNFRQVGSCYIELVRATQAMEMTQRIDAPTVKPNSGRGIHLAPM
jgi:hypothetical protein